MSGVVRTHPTKLTFRFRPGTPRRKIRSIQKEIKTKYEDLLVGDDKETVDWFETDLHKEIGEGLKPGDYLRHLREAHGLALREVAEKVGVNAQRVNDWESGYRGISKKFAKRLGEVFNISLAVFI